MWIIKKCCGGGGNLQPLSSEYESEKIKAVGSSAKSLTHYTASEPNIPMFRLPERHVHYSTFLLI
jgi:hypothetical protein